MPDAVAEPLDRSAARLGGYRWLEAGLFAATGRWASEDAPPAVQVHLSEASFQHAWHADLWADRLPVLASVDPAALTRAPSDRVAALLEGMAGAPDPVTRLAGLYRVVLPRLLVTYDLHRGATAPATDGPVVRALTLVRRDEAAQWRAGEALLQGLLATPEAVQRAHAHQRSLEEHLAGSGPGLLGE